MIRFGKVKKTYRGWDPTRLPPPLVLYARGLRTSRKPFPKLLHNRDSHIKVTGVLIVRFLGVKNEVLILVGVSDSNKLLGPKKIPTAFCYMLTLELQKYEQTYYVYGGCKFPGD